LTVVYSGGLADVDGIFHLFIIQEQVCF